MDISPRHKLVAACTVEDEITVVDASSGEVKFTLAGHRGGTACVAFLGGATLASCGEDGTARVWNLAHSTCVAELSVEGADADRSPAGCSVSHLAVAPGGRAFAVASGRSIVQFTVGGEGASAAAPRRRDLPPLPSTVEALRFDACGNLLAAYNGGCTLWKMATRTEDEKQALDLPYSVSAAIFLPLFHTPLCTRSRPRAPHTAAALPGCVVQGACLSVDMHPLQEWVVAGCHDNSVHIYRLVATRAAARRGGQGVQLENMTCGGYEAKVTATRFSPSGRWMASSGGRNATVWDFSSTPSGSTPTVTVGHRAAVTCLAWSVLEGAETLLTGCRAGGVYAYDVAAAAGQTSRPKVAPPGAEARSPGDEVTAVVWGRDGWFFSAHLSGFLRGWQFPLTPAGRGEEE
jgi:WD40 repeat protein